MRLRLLSICVGLLLVRSASAFVFSVDGSGTPFRWPSPVKPVFSANWNNVVMLSYSQIFTAFTNSLQRWKNSGGAAIDFDYYQGGSYPTQVGYDGVSSVFFASQSANKLAGSVLGATFVFYSRGTILEADVELNDEGFVFTTNPTDTSEAGDGVHVFLENVSTHEFGHAFGLAHSGVLQSTMVYLEDRTQSKPSCDDIEAIAASYPASAFASATGTLSGSVQTASAAAVFGAHVVAVSKTRGTVVAGAITQPDGAWSLPNLEPGDYYLMFEPFSEASVVAALCGGKASGCFYGNANSASVCPGLAPFKRAFLESLPGVLRLVTVAAGSNTAVGVFTVGCAALTDPWGVAAGSAGGAPQILANVSGGARGSAAVRGVMGAPGSAAGTQYFLLSNVSGSISAKVVAYGIYSPFDPKVTILDAGGVNTVSGASVTPDVFSDSSGYINYDALATLATGSGAANYYIQVTNNADLSANPSLYPAGLVGYGSANPQIDPTRYFALIVTINDATPLVPSTDNPVLVNNAKCERTDNFSAFPDHNGGPGSDASSDGAGGAVSGGPLSGCATISRGDGGHGGGPGFGAVFSAWGILLMLALGRVGQQLARRARCR